MKAALPVLFRKISRYKPRFVCFVGMGIWDVVQTALSQRRVRPKTSKDGKNKANEESGPGLQPYKFVYPADAGRSCVRLVKPQALR